MLARALNLGSTVAFVGAGCSIPLGYPTWEALACKLVDHAIATLNGIDDEAAVRSDVARLTALKERLTSVGNRRAESLMHAMSFCKQALSDARFPDIENPYDSFFKTQFGSRDPTARVDHQPLHLLLRFECITRFITTNYDCEIERALQERRAIPEEEFGTDGKNGWRSFTQEARYGSQLARFALAHSDDAENLVFHCHGRFDRPRSIVATEAEYQEWYLTPRGGAGPAFRQTLELLLGSNPLFFVGFGLADEDLLRPLRMFGATDLSRKDARPLFALLPERAEGADWERHEALYERYGVNVLPYTCPNAADGGKVLCEALKDLRRHWRVWRAGWLEKPFFRKVKVAPTRPEPYRHYSLEMKGLRDIGARRLNANLKRLEGHTKQFRVITLVGAGGAGKSWHAMRLLDRFQQASRRFAGFFFWSSYYADDLLTGLDRALIYLDPEGTQEGSRIERFRKCLQQDEYFLIFDGFERLLRETDTPGESKPDSIGVGRWLRAINDPESRSTIILTSRLWPYPDGTDGVKRFKIPQLTTDDLQHSETFRELDALERSALCSLLSGHVYGLSLARHVLRKLPKGERDRGLKRLLRQLSDLHPNARISRMIGLAVQDMDGRSNGLALKFLQRLAVFMSPVGGSTAQICYQLAEQDSTASHSGAELLPLRDLIVDLVEVRLIFQIATSDGAESSPMYSVHPAVRSYIFTQIHQVETDLLPNFTLPGFTSGTAAVYPGSDASARVVLDIFERLYEAGKAAFFAGRHQEARDLCRSALGVARSRMEANTAARWTSYDEYIRVGIHLVNLAKMVSPQVWSYVGQDDLRLIEAEEGPLYADELAWVYNDVGLTLCAEGAIQDAYAVWEQGSEINKVIDSEEEGGQYDVQSQLHFAHIFIEFGRLTEAEQYLEETKRLNHYLGDPDYAARVTGYSAQIAHMRNRLKESDRLYGEALGAWQEGRGNARAQSMFLYLRGELNSFMGNFEQAGHYIRSSRSIAEAGLCPDLVAYANNADGKLQRLQDHPMVAAHSYRAALQEARRIGLHKLEADVLTEQSLLALSIGDTDSANRRAVESLRIANEMALGLRLTNALYSLALATLGSGLRELGLEYLKLCKRLADRQSYWLQSRQIEKKLQELGESEAPRTGAGPFGWGLPA